MKANVYTIIEDRESGTFKAFISGPWDEDVEMVPEVEAKHLDNPYVCHRKHNRLYHSKYYERFPAEGKLKYYRDYNFYEMAEIHTASFWLSSENQSQDVINEILHQYYADVVSEACGERDYYVNRIKKLNAMWKATVAEHDK